MRMTRRDWMALAAAVLIGWLVSLGLRRAAPVGRDVGDNPIAAAILADRAAPALDPSNADLTLVVFTDYRCPACRRSAAALDAAVARDGRVRVVYRDWPIFGPASVRAARVALAAARQGIYPRLHTALMAEPRRLDPVVLRANVEQAGGDWQRLLRDLATHSGEIDAQLDRNRRDAQGLGLPGTPAYLIGPILVIGALNRAGFEKGIAQARREIRESSEKIFISSLDPRLAMIHFPDVPKGTWLQTAKGGDPMSHGSAEGSVKSVRETRA